MDNSKTLYLYAPTGLDIHPSSDATWADVVRIHDEYGEVSDINAKRSLPDTLLWLAERLRNGSIPGSNRDSLNVGVDPVGRYVVDIGIGPAFRSRVIIDPKKGYNLVERTDRFASARHNATYSRSADYKEIAPHSWILVSGAVDGVSDGVVVKMRLETTSLEIGGPEIPDSEFEIESLHVPPDIRTLDHHYKPPLVVSNDRSAKAAGTGRLAEVGPPSARAAVVTREGTPTTQAAVPSEGHLSPSGVYWIASAGAVLFVAGVLWVRKHNAYAIGK